MRNTIFAVVIGGLFLGVGLNAEEPASAVATAEPPSVTEEIRQLREENKKLSELTSGK